MSVPQFKNVHGDCGKIFGRLIFIKIPFCSRFLPETERDFLTYNFLSRPRRFDKSLLISTLQSYFEGKKDLFKGFKIEKLEKDWTEYPVITLSFASCKSDKIDEIRKFVSIMLSRIEFEYNLVDKEEDANDDKEPNTKFNDRLLKIINTAYQQTVNPLCFKHIATWFRKKTKTKNTTF